MWVWPIRGWLAKARLFPEESSTNEPHEQTSLLIGTSFSCRDRGSNPGPTGNSDALTFQAFVRARLVPDGFQVAHVGVVESIAVEVVVVIHRAHKRLVISIVPLLETFWSIKDEPKIPTTSHIQQSYVLFGTSQYTVSIFATTAPFHLPKKLPI